MNAERRKEIIVELLKEFGTGTEEGYVEKIGNRTIDLTEKALPCEHEKTIILGQNRRGVWCDGVGDRKVKDWCDNCSKRKEILEGI